MKAKRLGHFRVNTVNGPSFMYRHEILSATDEEMAKLQAHADANGYKLKPDEATGNIVINLYNKGENAINEIQFTQKDGRPFIADEKAELIHQISQIEDPTMRQEVAKLAAVDILAGLKGKSAAPVATTTEAPVSTESANLGSEG